MNFTFWPTWHGKDNDKAVATQAAANFIKHIDVDHIFKGHYQLDRPMFLGSLSTYIIESKLPIFIGFVKEKIF
jgi:hypothetical protein